MSEINFSSLLRDREKDVARLSTTVRFADLLKNKERGVLTETEMAQEFARSITGQPSLKGSGLSFSERAKLSFLGDTPEEQKAAFEQSYPEGEYLPIPNTDVTIFRRGQDDNFMIADPSFGQSLGEGRLMGDTLRDIAGFAGDLPEIAGETAAMLLTKGKGGGFATSAGYIKDMLRLFGGAFAGSEAQQAAQYAAGTQKQSVREQAQQAAGEGTLSVVGGTVGDVIGRGINVVRGSGSIGRTPEGIQAQEAAERLGIEGSLPVSAVTDNPLVKIIAKQSASINSKVGRELRKFNDALIDMTNKKVKPAEAKRFTKRGLAVLKKQNDVLLLGINRQLNRGLPTEQVAPIIKQSVEKWWHETSKTHVDSLYDFARTIEEPRFDIPSLQQRGKEIAARPSAPTPSTRTVTREKVPAPKKPFYLTKITDTGPGTVEAGQITPVVESVLSKIAKIDPDAEVDLKFLKALRQEIWDASLPGPNGERILDAQARELRGTIQNIIENPLNTNPDFVGAWKAADRAAIDRFETRELIAVSEMINTDMPRAALKRIMSPGNKETFEKLAQINRALDNPRDFEKLGDAFVEELMLDPKNIPATLDGYDAATKRMLLSESKEAALRGYNAKLSRLDSTKLQQALSEQATISEQVEQILNNPQSRGIEEFRKLVRDRGGPFKTSVRAAVLEGIMRKIRATSSGGAEVLDGKKLKGIISEYRESGVWNLLEFHDQAFLNDVQKVRSVLSVSGDAGTSIRAAQVASGLVEFADTAFFEFLESFTTGRILTSEGGKRFLIGSAHNKVTDVGHIRLMGSIITTISQDVERED